MDEEWIDARYMLCLAAAVVGDAEAESYVFRLANNGSLPARANGQHRLDDDWLGAAISPGFWPAISNDLSETDWADSRFIRLKPNGCRWETSGVQFNFANWSATIAPAALREGLSRFSVAFDQSWLSAIAARTAIMRKAIPMPMDSGATLLAHCKLGHINARAVKMQEASGMRPDKWVNTEREWDIPLWFWQNFTEREESAQLWETGVFAGRAHFKGSHRWLTLSGVHFERKSLGILIPEFFVDQPAPMTIASQIENCPPIPRDELRPLAESLLQKWWDGKAQVRDALSHSELLTLARAAFPNNHVARDRIRNLAGVRKRGRKPIGDERPPIRRQ
jgi:hypothetical protein